MADQEPRKIVNRGDLADQPPATDFEEYDTAGTGQSPVRGQGPTRRRAGLLPDERDPDAPAEAPGSAGGEVNMSGTPAGGTSMGGMAGENEGAGTFDDAQQISNAFGDGTYDDLGNQRDDDDVDITDVYGVDAADSPDINPDDVPYSGHSGGAVGGTPANMRAEGGHQRRGFSPGPGSKRGDTTIGGNPDDKSDDRQT